MQGCSLSPYLLFCVEVLPTAICGDEIKGSSVANVECKLSQYADEATMTLDGSQGEFRSIVWPAS